MLDLMFTVFDRDRSNTLTFAEFVIGFGTFNHELATFRVRCSPRYFPRGLPFSSSNPFSFDYCHH